LAWEKVLILIFFPSSISLSVQVKDANQLLGCLSTRDVDNILIGKYYKIKNETNLFGLRLFKRCKFSLTNFKDCEIGALIRGHSPENLA
jgi:hypothetical protein